MRKGVDATIFGLPENPSKENVVKFMKESTSDEDWNERCDLVKKKFGGNYPDFWYKEIILGDIKPKGGDIKIVIQEVSDSLLLPPVEEIGTEEDLNDSFEDLEDLNPLEDLKDLYIYGNIEIMPNLKYGYNLICEYDQGVKKTFFLCNNIKGVKELYKSYSEGRALDLKRYSGKPKLS